MNLPEGMVGLPVLVSTPGDIGRLIREVEAVDNAMLQESLSGKNEGGPKLTSLLEQTIQMNKLDVTSQDDRAKLQNFLQDLHDNAPTLHMSFSAEPNTPFMEKLIAWLRREVHPLVLVTVGLQPNLGAGCVVRTTNKYFDLSMRKDFESATGSLAEQLAKIGSQADAGKIEVKREAAPREQAAAAQEVHA